MLPNDPIILLSYMNTQLRDHYSSLEDLADSLDIDLESVLNKLRSAGYEYSKEVNRFIQK